MDRLLQGIRVLDLTNVLAGPFGAYQLALLGADVIKVEAPGSGDLARQLGADTQLNRDLMGASFLAQNAGKRSVTVNLKSDAGKEVFFRLVRSADVVIENFRPGVMARLGLGYFATGDGPLNIAANRQQQFETLARLIGRPIGLWGGRDRGATPGEGDLSVGPVQHSFCGTLSQMGRFRVWSSALALRSLNSLVTEP